MSAPDEKKVLGQIHAVAGEKGAYFLDDDWARDDPDALVALVKCEGKTRFEVLTDVFGHCWREDDLRAVAKGRRIGWHS